MLLASLSTTSQAPVHSTRGSERVRTSPFLLQMKLWKLTTWECTSARSGLSIRSELSYLTLYSRLFFSCVLSPICIVYCTERRSLFSPPIIYFRNSASTALQAASTCLLRISLDWRKTVSFFPFCAKKKTREHCMAQLPVYSTFGHRSLVHFSHNYLGQKLHTQLLIYYS